MDYVLNQAGVAADQPLYMEACITTEKGSECIFPFTYNKVEYYACPKHKRRKHKYWCSTKVDKNGVHIKGKDNWGFCGPRCPKMRQEDRLTTTTRRNPTTITTTTATASKIPIATTTKLREAVTRPEVTLRSPSLEEIGIIRVFADVGTAAAFDQNLDGTVG